MVVEKRLTYSVDEVANLLGVSRRNVYALAADNKIPGQFRFGQGRGRILVSKAALDKWLKNPECDLVSA